MIKYIQKTTFKILNSINSKSKFSAIILQDPKELLQR